MKSPDILEILWFSGFILAKGCVDIAGIALRYPKTKMPLVPGDGGRGKTGGVGLSTGKKNIPYDIGR